MNHPLQRQLQQSIMAAFHIDELPDLCLELDLREDELAGETIQGKTRSLIGRMNREGRLFELMTAAADLRPGRNWQPLLAQLPMPLEKIPLDHVPDPAQLPPGSRMLWRYNPIFVGRDEILLELASSMCQSNSLDGYQTVALTGMGGLGKTQLAIEFAHRYGQFFPGGVFWLNMETAENVPGEVAACGGPEGLNLPNFTDQPLEVQISQVQAAWSETLPRLLIFDNCEDEALLAQWRPVTGGCRCLITSRRGLWDAVLGVRRLPLGNLTETAALQLLECTIQQQGNAASLSHHEKHALTAIAAEVGNLPLALHLAGNFLHRYWGDVSIIDYLAELQAVNLNHPSLTGERAGRSYTDHDLNVRRTFAISLGRLVEDDPVDCTARQLLARASHLAPAIPIPRALLLTGRSQQRGRLSRLYHWLRRRPSVPMLTKEIQIDGLRRLQALGLLTTEENNIYQLHSLLAAFARDALADLDAQPAAEQAVLAELNRRIDQAGFYGQMPLLESHLRHVTVQSQERADAQTALLCNHLGYYLKERGDARAALPFYQRALAIRERVFGPEHAHTATSLNNLGGLLRSMGELSAARPFFERALTVYEKTLGPEHANTAASLNNLGGLLYNMGDLASARPVIERALAICEKTLGPEHPDTAASLNNLGWLLYNMGELEEARPCIERALGICEKVLGSEHPATATSLSNLGGLLRSTGDFAAARPYYERTLAIREKVLGLEHPATATSLNNLGGLLYNMGELDEARPYYAQALVICEEVLGPEHPHTATSLNNLGALLDAMGDFEAAWPYYERTLAIREKVLGPEHPDTAQSLNNLGALLDNTGDFAAARPFYERTLAIREKILGPEHAHTATSLNNLGGLLYNMGDLEAARPFFERALTIYEKVLGPEHPFTVASLNNLGGLFYNMGDLAAARPFVERALAICERTLGTDHPDTATDYNNLAWLFHDEGNLPEAARLMQRALTIREQRLGTDHPDTKESRQSLALIEAKLTDQLPPSHAPSEDAFQFSPFRPTFSPNKPHPPVPPTSPK